MKTITFLLLIMVLLPKSTLFGQTERNFPPPPEPEEVNATPKAVPDFKVEKRNGKYGMIDKTNREVVPFEYDKFIRVYIDYNKNIKTNYYKVSKNNLFGIIDIKGKVLIPVIYTDLGRLTYEVYYAGKSDGTYRMLSLDGKEMHPFTLEGTVLEGIGDQYIAKKGGKTGIININGETILPFTFDEITRNTPVYRDEASLYIVKNDGKYGVINETGQNIIPIEYSSISSNRWQGNFNLEKDGKHGLADRLGKFLIPLEYDKMIYSLSHGFHIVVKNNLSGVLNTSYKEILPSIYRRIEVGNPRYFKIQLDRKEGVADTLGNIVLECKFRRIAFCGEKLIFAVPPSENLLAIYDEKGQQVTKPTYYRAKMANDYAIVEKTDQGKSALFHSISGTEITPFIYDNIRVVKDRRSGDYKIAATRDGSMIELSTEGKEIK